MVVARHLDRITVDVRDEDASGPERRAHHHRAPPIPLDGDPDRVGVSLAVFTEGRLLEAVLEALALGDSQRVAEALVVRPEAHQPADDRLVGPVPLTSPGERAMELDPGTVRRAADETARE